MVEDLKVDLPEYVRQCIVW